jgi:hypothetical protein
MDGMGDADAKEPSNMPLLLATQTSLQLASPLVQQLKVFVL